MCIRDSLFVVVPAIELAILIQVGSLLGALPTFALIVVTGMVGAALAKRQGLGVLRKLRAGPASGTWPGQAIADGAIILVAGAFLVTPGILTDVVGFLCLVPAVRERIRGHLRKRFEQAVARGTVQTVDFPPTRRPASGGPVIDVTPHPRDR